MERLFEESEQDVATTRRLRDVLRKLSSKEIAFAIALGRGECPPDAMWQSVQTVGMLPAFNAPRSVYEELMGAGGLSSIERPEVRSAVATFNTKVDWSQSQNEYFRAGASDPVEPSDKRISIRYAPGTAGPLIVTYDREALCADHEFRNKMASAVRNHMVITGYHEDVTDESIKMCALLGKSLNRQCIPSSEGPLAGPDGELARAVIRSPQKNGP